MNPAVWAELDRLRKLYAEQGQLSLVCWCAPMPCHVEVIREYLLKETKMSNQELETTLAGEYARQMAAQMLEVPVKELDEGLVKRIVTVNELIVRSCGQGLRSHQVVASILEAWLRETSNPPRSSSMSSLTQRLRDLGTGEVQRIRAERDKLQEELWRANEYIETLQGSEAIMLSRVLESAQKRKRAAQIATEWWKQRDELLGRTLKDAKDKPVGIGSRLWFVHPELDEIWSTSGPRPHSVVTTINSVEDSDDSFEIEYADCYTSKADAEEALRLRKESQ